MIAKTSVMLILLALACLPTTLFPGVASAQGQAADTTSDLRVTVVASQDIGPNYVQVEAAMRGTIMRADGSQGSYEVPVTIAYPKDPAACNGFGLVDVVNSVFYETFDGAGTENDPFFPSLFPVARLILGDDFIQQGGYVYAFAQWNKLVIERQRQAGTLADSEFHIDEGKDGYLILRDLSHFLRTPADVFVGSPVLCASGDIVSFGYSQTGMLLRQFYFAGLNTRLAAAPAFDEGLVFEGSIHAVPGSHCRSLSDQSPWFSYSFRGCSGDTPRDQGRVITINTETDLQVSEAWKARPDNERKAGDHYRVYEIAGTSHIPTSLLPLKAVGLRPADDQEQNYADTAPVFRAMVQHLQDWITDDREPPQNALVQGHVGKLDTPLFSSNSWGSDGEQIFIAKLGADGNTLGGVRLPHVRTILSNKQQIGGPLGVYRGLECDNDAAQSDFILNCSLGGDSSIYNMAGGTFKPYTAFRPDLCGTFYEDSESYLSAVRNAAELAAASGWVLPQEVDSLVLAAKLEAEAFPGCVPTSG